MLDCLVGAGSDFHRVRYRFRGQRYMFVTLYKGLAGGVLVWFRLGLGWFRVGLRFIQGWFRLFLSFFRAVGLGLVWCGCSFGLGLL